MDIGKIKQIFSSFYETKGYNVFQSRKLLHKVFPYTFIASVGVIELREIVESRNPASSRRVGVQKCFRHFDMVRVNDGLHTSFFEMLGAISINWGTRHEFLSHLHEFFTKCLSIDPDSIWISVFGGDNALGLDLPADEETYQTFKKIGVPEKHLIKGNKETNLWGLSERERYVGNQVEIFVERQNVSEITGSNPFEDSRRFLEIATAVFFQYKKTDKGHLIPLDALNIHEVGIGVERLSMIVNNRESICEIDELDNLLSKIESVTQDAFNKRYASIVADHIRAIVMILSDGGIPGPRGRQYVLRKLIRRFLLALEAMKIRKGEVVKNLVKTVIDLYRPWYNLCSSEDMVNIILEENEKYSPLISKRLPGFKQASE